MKSIQILGTRGIPANHGGFETFAEKLALHLKDKGWDVTVYCQVEKKQSRVLVWKGINLVYIPAPSGSIGTIIFDLKSIMSALKKPGVALMLGYNTAIFNILFKLVRKPILINMDGVEWRRAKWGVLAKCWFYINEHCGQAFSDHLIADHPKIRDHLERFQFYKRRLKREITVIPYGADKPVENTVTALLNELGIDKPYALVIARPEPENSIDIIVSAFCKKNRNAQLVVLGQYHEGNAYQKLVTSLASAAVIFPGAIYDKEKISILRMGASFYVHGHTVGGTNPALVEAMAVPLPILAHDNPFNRWVAGAGSEYFVDVKSCEEKMTTIFDSKKLRFNMRDESKKQFEKNFLWDDVLLSYEKLLTRYLN